MLCHRRFASQACLCCPFPPFRELLDGLFPANPHIKIWVSSYSLCCKTQHANGVVHKTVCNGGRRKKGGFLPVLMGIRNGADTDSKLLAWCQRWNLCLAGRHPLTINVDDTSLAFALPALVADEHVCTRSHVAQGLTNLCHRLDVLRLEDNWDISKLLMARYHLWWPLFFNLQRIINLRDNCLLFACRPCKQCKLGLFPLYN
mmetsp:Transcript_7659/g.14588  ORF Transcript_7659/g.14588 Transcript_7659/m.14588 type:complete len:202 (+) Transcript_7659:283-888(+)